MRCMIYFLLIYRVIRKVSTVSLLAIGKEKRDGMVCSKDAANKILPVNQNKSQLKNLVEADTSYNMY